MVHIKKKSIYIYIYMVHVKIWCTQKKKYIYIYIYKMTQIIATKSINMGREKLPHVTTTICINLNLLMILEAHAPRSEK